MDGIPFKYFIFSKYGKEPDQEPLIDGNGLFIPRIGEKVVLQGVPCVVKDILYILSGEREETEVEAHILIQPPEK